MESDVTYKYFNRLHNHIFLREVASDSLPLMDPKYTKEFYDTLSAEQSYKYECGRRIGQVMNQIDKTVQAAILLNSYPNIKAWRNEYGVGAYFQYHYEFYLLSMTGLLDRLWLLVNTISQLGLQERRVNFVSLTKKLNDVELIKHVQHIQNSMANIITVRNRVAHEYRYQDDSIHSMIMLEWAIVENESFSVNEKMMLKADLDFYSFSFKRLKQALVKKNEAALEDLLCGIFDKLLLIYELAKTDFS